jgi:Polysaccharide pyruvyl transferase
MGTKTLVMGWFSFERADATAGDLIAKNVVCEWLESAGRDYDVALAAPFEGGIEIESVGGGDYEHVIFVCGPFFRNDLLRRLEPSKLVGVNLSMVAPVAEWNPFDLLMERDSTAASRPDITFLGATPEELPEQRADRVPAVGVVLMDPDDVPADREHHEAANEAVERLIASRPAETVRIDTRLDVPNRAGLRTPAEVEGGIACRDLVITTRLHGLVLAIKNGVPATAVDPIPGGGKLTRQARSIEWPLILAADAPAEELERAFDHCLTPEARGLAARSRDLARKALAPVRRRFIEAMRSPVDESWGDGRRRGGWLGDGAPTASGPSGWARRVARRISAALPVRQR